MIASVLTLAAVSAAASTVIPAPVPSKRPIAPVVRRTADLYSLRARRRLQSLLRLQLLELREANLERARAVVEHRLKIEDVLKR